MTYTLQFDVSGVTTDLRIVDDSTPFNVQWKTQNLGPDGTGEFVDHLVIRSVDECPGDDSDSNPVVYDSDTDPNVDLTEPPLPANQLGPLMQAPVGPYPAGSYRLSVTLDENGANPVTTFNCIEIEAS